MDDDADDAAAWRWQALVNGMWVDVDDVRITQYAPLGDVPITLTATLAAEDMDTSLVIPNG